MEFIEVISCSSCKLLGLLIIDLVEETFSTFLGDRWFDAAFEEDWEIAPVVFFFIRLLVDLVD